jgi:ATP-dependent protease ClpP protease subunit
VRAGEAREEDNKMNKILGFMNVLLLTALLIGLIFGYGDGVERQHAVIGTVLTFIPITFTMLALEPQARFLRTAIAANAAIIALFIVGSRATNSSAASVLILPFVFNIAGLIRIWFRIRSEREELALALPADATDPTVYPGLEPLPKETFEPEEPARNYFVRHWRGQLTLPVSYWVNGWGATALCAGLMFAANKLLDDISVRGAAAAALAFLVLLLAVTAWLSVGIWRSAGHHVSRGGARGWAVTAQILMVFSAVVTVSNFFIYRLPQMKEHWLIATGRDPMGQITVELTRDKRAVVLSGTLGAGSVSKVSALLDEAPEATTIVLDSFGGRIAEGVLIAKLVRERKLNTYVETHCESACTLVFLAGADRAATPHAQIGFHRAFFPGMDPALDARMTERMLEHYRAAGVSEPFLARVSETKAEHMWYPTSDELLEAHVVNRVSLGGETAVAASKFQSRAHVAFTYAGDAIMGTINDHFPGAVDAAAAAAWELHERGESDAAMWAAARKVILKYYRKLLRTADEPSLRAYLQIHLDQLRAARDVSDEACALLADSSLDVGQTLPRELYERELTWLQRALAASKQAPVAAVDTQLFGNVMQRLTERLTAKVTDVVQDTAAHANQPQVLCRASLEFYEAVRALPPRERVVVVRGLFQGGSGE